MQYFPVKKMNSINNFTKIVDVYQNISSWTNVLLIAGWHIGNTPENAWANGGCII